MRADDEVLGFVLRRLGVRVGLLVGRGWPLQIYLGLSEENMSKTQGIYLQDQKNRDEIELEDTLPGRRPERVRRF